LSPLNDRLHGACGAPHPLWHLRTGDDRRGRPLGPPMPDEMDYARPITNVGNTASRFWTPWLRETENRCLVPVSAFSELTRQRPRAKIVMDLWFARDEARSQFFFAGKCGGNGQANAEPKPRRPLAIIWSPAHIRLGKGPTSESIAKSYLQFRPPERPSHRARTEHSAASLFQPYLESQNQPVRMNRSSSKHESQ
jgi:hypothetical protein